MNTDETNTPTEQVDSDQDPGTGSGEGGSLGTPATEPPSDDQGTEGFISGDGMIQTADEDEDEDEDA